MQANDENRALRRQISASDGPSSAVPASPGRAGNAVSKGNQRPPFGLRPRPFGSVCPISGRRGHPRANTYLASYVDARAAWGIRNMRREQWISAPYAYCLFTCNADRHWHSTHQEKPCARRDRDRASRLIAEREVGRGTNGHCVLGFSSHRRRTPSSELRGCGRSFQKFLCLLHAGVERSLRAISSRGPACDLGVEIIESLVDDAGRSE